MVAAAKLRKAQDRITQMRPYAQRLQGILANVSATMEQGADNPYAQERPAEKVLIVTYTSDKGLCGGFNSNIFKSVRQLLEERYAAQQAAGNVQIMTVGTKARDYYKRRKATANFQYTDLLQNLAFDEARQAAESAMEGFNNGTYDQVVLVYNEFKNVATQMVRVEQFLPLSPAAITEEVKQGAKSTLNDYIFEPGKEEIVQELIPKTLKIQFYKALLESNASEQGARMTAMDKATENAGELLKELKLTYNRTRQAAITKEILEIVGGAEALNN